MIHGTPRDKGQGTRDKPSSGQLAFQSDSVRCFYCKALLLITDEKARRTPNNARSTSVAIQRKDRVSNYRGSGSKVKSVQKKLLEAAELATSVGITNNDIESVDVYDYGTAFRLKPVALSRVFRQNRIPHSKLRINDINSMKELYVSFMYRGVRWSTFINREVMEEFKATIEANSVERIDGTIQPRLNACKQRCLPAPV